MNLLVAQDILEKRRGLGTYVSVGAMHIIQTKRQKEFLESTIPTIVQEAQTLGISSQELLFMIEKEMTR